MGVDESDWSGCFRKIVKISTIGRFAVEPPLVLPGEKRRTNPSRQDVARDGVSDITSLRGEVGMEKVGGGGCGIEGLTKESSSINDPSEGGVSEELSGAEKLCHMNR